VYTVWATRTRSFRWWQYGHPTRNRLAVLNPNSDDYILTLTVLMYPSKSSRISETTKTRLPSTKCIQHIDMAINLHYGGVSNAAACTALYVAGCRRLPRCTYLSLLRACPYYTLYTFCFYYLWTLASAADRASYPYNLCVFYRPHRRHSIDAAFATDVTRSVVCVSVCSC